MTIIQGKDGKVGMVIINDLGKTSQGKGVNDIVVQGLGHQGVNLTQTKGNDLDRKNPFHHKYFEDHYITRPNKVPFSGTHETVPF